MRCVYKSLPPSASFCSVLPFISLFKCSFVIHRVGRESSEMCQRISRECKKESCKQDKINPVQKPGFLPLHLHEDLDQRMDEKLFFSRLKQDFHHRQLSGTP